MRRYPQQRHSGGGIFYVAAFKLLFSVHRWSGRYPCAGLQRYAPDRRKHGEVP
nr:MAG TPA: hypothetical protein [Caudoviricetes sp.]